MILIFIAMLFVMKYISEKVLKTKLHLSIGKKKDNEVSLQLIIKSAEKELFKGILKSNGTKRFMDEFRKQIAKFADSYFRNYPYHGEIPIELQKSIAVENFIVILNYWVNNELEESPEMIAKYFIDSVFPK